MREASKRLMWLSVTLAGLPYPTVSFRGDINIASGRVPITLLGCYLLFTVTMFSGNYLLFPPRLRFSVGNASSGGTISP